MTAPSETERAEQDPPVELLSRTADGLVVPSARERARFRLADRYRSWAAALGVTLLAGFLRLWQLGEPNEFEFDETYYAKDAWSMLNHGFVQTYPGEREDVDASIISGHTDGIWGGDPSLIVHPPVGKWMIALGEKAFGMDPFGWRIAAVVTGTLMVLVMCRLVRRLTGSTLVGCLAGLFLCFDGMHLVLSRLALLDIFLAFWLLCAVAALVVDRDWTRDRITRLPGGTWGPLRGLWFRPWRLTAGVCFGLAIGTKWSGLYALALFGLLVWAWDSGARRSIGVRWAWLRSALVDAVPAFAHLVLAALLVYVVSWSGWLVNAHEYEESLSDTGYTEETLGHPWPTATEPDAEGVVAETWQSLRSLYYYHRDVYQFHTHDLDDSEHAYESDPRGWLLLNRPVGVNVDNNIDPGTDGCTAEAGSHCIRQVLVLGTPILWWGALLALIYAAVAWIARRDWRYGLAVIGAIGMWWPWELNDDRPIFLFYASAIFPFLVIALAMTCGEILGRAPAPSPRRTVGTIVVGSFFVLVLLNFAWFWPIWTNELLTESEWLDRMWFRRWI